MNTRHRTFLALLLALPLAACAGRDDSRKAPDFALSSPDGKTVSLSAQKGRVVLLNFWATWCDSCRAELPALKDLNARSNGRFVLLAVNVDEDPGKAVPPFLAREKLDFPIAYADPAVLGAYAVRDLPTTFLIGPDGEIKRRYVGPLDEGAVENDILQLLRRPS
ncbi:MAG: TlpA family protein disulfide reductase [Elusimicrobia bacterium]|nr:TlpA family protein disulfide reductase [Elusimicrobiota bacterium]